MTRGISFTCGGELESGYLLVELLALAAVGEVEVERREALDHLVERALRVLARLPHLQVVLRAELAQPLAL